MKTFIKTTLVGLVLWGNTMLLHAQNIAFCEYYIDNDPGFGMGTPLSITPDTSVIVSAQISLPVLNSGSHRLTLRCRDQSGRWSIQQTRTFSTYIPQPQENQLTEAEYWIGNDPGLGNGTPLPLTIDSAITLLSNLTIPSAGNNSLSVRFRSNLGKWSIPQTRAFQALSPETMASQLVALEYYFDNNESIKQTLSVNPATILDTTVRVSTSALNVGVHSLSISTRNNLGKKSFPEIRWSNLNKMQPQDSLSMFAIYLDDTLHVDNPVQKKIIAPATAFNDTLRIKLSPSAGE
ncbi:MAG: hypothetical protein N2662_11775, partial [Bacteroidales bacterium]|nr:hypothetical protein [Bacteroidales bacterium]